ncbi:MAG: hypothetical protein ACI9BH_002260 [Paracoccaceae bacterium]|jgi:uncharacterized protein (TIGR02453 family)
MPSDPFAALPPEARAFLSELATQNNRDWFAAHKAHYNSTLKTPAALLLDQIAYDMGRQMGQTLSPKLFRAHRDVRFTKDKTPYHTHLHMMWTIGGTGPARPALFLGIAPDYVRIGGGLIQFDKTTLPDWRTAVTGDFGTLVQTLLGDLAKAGLLPDTPELKRIPAPYAKDHPQGELLRRKGLAVWGHIPATDWPTPLATLNRQFGQIRPLLELLKIGF